MFCYFFTCWTRAKIGCLLRLGTPCNNHGYGIFCLQATKKINNEKNKTTRKKTGKHKVYGRKTDVKDCAPKCYENRLKDVSKTTRDLSFTLERKRNNKRRRNMKKKETLINVHTIHFPPSLSIVFQFNKLVGKGKLNTKKSKKVQKFHTKMQ